MLVENDKMLRRELPRVKREAVEIVKARYGPDNILRDAALLDVDNEIAKRKSKWQLYVIQSMAEVTGTLLKLREKHGMEDKQLQEQVRRIVAEFKHFESSWEL